MDLWGSGIWESWDPWRIHVCYIYHIFLYALLKTTKCRWIYQCQSYGSCGFLFFAACLNNLISSFFSPKKEQYVFFKSLIDIWWYFCWIYNTIYNVCIIYITMFAPLVYSTLWRWRRRRFCQNKRAAISTTKITPTGPRWYLGLM